MSKKPSKQVNNFCWWCGKTIEWPPMPWKIIERWFSFLCTEDQNKKDEVTTWTNGKIIMKFTPHFKKANNRDSMNFEIKVAS